MTGSPTIDVSRAMGAIEDGLAERLDGRGVNSSYRVGLHGRLFSVKVHCADRSSDLELQRILRVDAALRGTAWYPRVIDIGLHTAAHPRLVVIRPFAPGAPPTGASRHIGPLMDVLADLALRAKELTVVDGLTGDYASPWLDDRENELRATAGLVKGRPTALARAAEDHLAELCASARLLTRPGTVFVYHGDLHGRNLVLGGSQRLTVIDWDEAGFSRRPADAAKALWLSCRRGRGDFVLDPVAVRCFLEHLHRRLRTPYTAAGHLARLGALWFLPRQHHVALLGRRDAHLVPWYLDWVSRFWSRFEPNLTLLTETAAALADESGSRPETSRSTRDHMIRDTSVTTM
ncbi:phosphotransferase [Streptomyces sp. NPDC001811]